MREILLRHSSGIHFFVAALLFCQAVMGVMLINAEFTGPSQGTDSGLSFLVFAWSLLVAIGYALVVKARLTGGLKTTVLIMTGLNLAVMTLGLLSYMMTLYFLAPVAYLFALVALVVIRKQGMT